MSELKGSRTEANLKAAFSNESQVNRRYLHFARHADEEGYNDVAAIFRATAESEAAHAHGALRFLEDAGDPTTGEAMGGTAANLRASIAGETREAQEIYPEMARTAREEGFEEIARWFEALAKAERGHTERFRRALKTLDT